MVIVSMMIVSMIVSMVIVSMMIVSMIVSMVIVSMIVSMVIVSMVVSMVIIVMVMVVTVASCRGDLLHGFILCRFRELLFEFSACEDNSEMLVEALDPLLERPPGQLKSEGGGVAVAQLHSWVQGVLR